MPTRRTQKLASKWHQKEQKVTILQVINCLRSITQKPKMKIFIWQKSKRNCKLVRSNFLKAWNNATLRIIMQLRSKLLWLMNSQVLYWFPAEQIRSLCCDVPSLEEKGLQYWWMREDKLKNDFAENFLGAL